ncbi:MULTISPECIES: KTSC domain-containing protein [unclassified Mesorhizobium]|uniref:KTSC domain-containing protein n=1 Tax=unclassified Mesorhizobium TaxID=325217 RepID=UPI003338B527
MERAYLTGKFHRQKLVLTLPLSQKSNVRMMPKGAASFLCILVGTRDRRASSVHAAIPPLQVLLQIGIPIGPRSPQGRGPRPVVLMPSTSIRKMEYDLDRRTLSVWFVASGKRYEFEGVPPETFAAFRAAFAKGRYFNDHIRNNFRYRLVASDSDPG